MLVHTAVASEMLQRPSNLELNHMITNAQGHSIDALVNVGPCVTSTRLSTIGGYRVTVGDVSIRSEHDSAGDNRGMTTPVE